MSADQPTPTPSLPASIREALDAALQKAEELGQTKARYPRSGALIASADRLVTARTALEAHIGALVADAERLDWLSLKAVRVGTKLNVGTFVEWHACPMRDDDGTITPADLRGAIDDARSAAARTPPEDTTP